MKTFTKISMILTVVVVIFSCRKEPEIPEPATPKGLSYQIQDGSILFSWFPAEDALTYGMEIAKDAELADLIFTKDGIEDTFQLVSCDSFEFDSTYYWRVRAEGEAGWGEWSDVASFTYSSEGGLDLDTTYFPFGLGYEWCFERHHYGWGDDSTWDWYDTSTLSVIDSFWEGDSLFFRLESGFLFLSNPVKIWDNQIVIHGYLSDTVSITPDGLEKDSLDGDEYYGISRYLRISYLEDTLHVLSWEREYWWPSPYECVWWSGIKRLKNIGAVYQEISYGEGAYLSSLFPYEQYNTTVYRLISFTTPQGRRYP